MKNNPLSRVELFFWNLTIQALSESGVARIGLCRAYQLAHNSEAASMGILVGVTGVAGLLSGYLFYFLTGGLR